MVYQDLNAIIIVWIAVASLLVVLAVLMLIAYRYWGDWVDGDED